MDDHLNFPQFSPEPTDDIDWDEFLAEIKQLDNPEPEYPSIPVIPAARTAKPKTKRPAPALSAGKKRLMILVAAVLVLVILGSVLLPELLDPYDRKILPGVTVGGLDVGGMTRSEAKTALKDACADTLDQVPLTLHLPEETLQLSPSNSGLSLRAGAAVRAAYRVGRSGSRADRQAAVDASQAGQTQNVGLSGYLSLKEKNIRSVLVEYAQQYDTDYADGSWCTVGTLPDLSTALSADQIECQTLQVTLGVPTARLDQEDAYSRILSAYDTGIAACQAGTFTAGDFKVDILKKAPQTDLGSIHKSLSVAAVDDSLDMKTYKPVTGSYGYGFDLDAARKQLAAADHGETLTIPMTLTVPQIIGEGVYFRDILGQCETPHTKDENRNHNLALACKAMDGLILQPGDVFSYNDTLGQRTKERGYKKAGAYSGWELVQSYGGGICQGSSTIYCAALYADLEIVIRKNHGYRVSYIPAGLDATVNWGGPDFQFRNNTHFPVKIAAEVSDGFVKVKLLGTEERDYYIEMESQSSEDKYAIYAKSYKCKYDRETGELISRELEARSTYNH